VSLAPPSGRSARKSNSTNAVEEGALGDRRGALGCGTCRRPRRGPLRTFSRAGLDPGIEPQPMGDGGRGGSARRSESRRQRARFRP
jgi:hypothetical protein